MDANIGLKKEGHIALHVSVEIDTCYGDIAQRTKVYMESISLLYSLLSMLCFVFIFYVRKTNFECVT